MDNDFFPKVIAINAGDTVLNLSSFVRHKIHEYLISDATLICSGVKSTITIPQVGTFYLNGIETFITNELCETIVNNICFNVVKAIKEDYVSSLVSCTQSSQHFYSVFIVDYVLDRNRLISMLINNENPMGGESPDNIYWTKEEILEDYIDDFNHKVTREVYKLFEYLLKTANGVFTSLLIDVLESVYDSVARMFEENKIKGNIRPISVFVSTISYDLIIIN